VAKKEFFNSIGAEQSFAGAGELPLKLIADPRARIGLRLNRSTRVDCPLGDR